VIHKRANVVKPEMMADETTFESTDRERVPTAYFVPAEQKVALERLRAHGIQLEPLTAPVSVPLQEFEVATSTTTAQAFESHQERTVTGAWMPVERTVPAGAWRVSIPRWRGWRSICSSRVERRARHGTCSTRP
jgi:hypothetical protein